MALTPSVHAQSSSTVAEALFSEGRRLLDEGKYDEACAKFAESQRLDPGTGTLLNLANCYEQAGRFATAWSTWKEAASSARDAGQTDREQLARGKAAELEGKLARLTIEVPEEARVPGLVIKRDGEELTSAIWGTPLPVDAGTRKIEATAEGYLPFSTDIALTDGTAQKVAIPKLEVDPNYQKQPETAPTPATAEDRGTDPGKTQRIIGYVVGGVGIVGIGVGTYFGIDAINKNNDAHSNNQCNSTGTSCTETAYDQIEAARRSGTASSVAIGVGAAALVGGFVLVITAPKASTQVALSPRYDGASVVFSGKF